MELSLSQSEWKVMECLWIQGPRTLMQMVKELEAATGWSASTIKTMVGRMTAKGHIRYEEGGRARLYYPCLTREEAAARETESLLRRAYRGKLGLLVNTMVDRQRLSDQELEELYAILDRAKGGS